MIATPQEQTVARLTELGVAVDRLRDSEAWQAMLAVSRQFHDYSALNQVLIWSQCPTATRVAGYRKWQELGRQVRRGEHGLAILAPLRRKNDEGETEIRGFRIVKVFDVTQTDGEPLPEVVWPEADHVVEGLAQHLIERATAAGLTVVYPAEPNPASPTARGWYERDTLTIHVVGRDKPASECKTLLHELAHHFDPGLAESDRQGRELVAESAAWVAAGPLGVGMDSTAHHYLASWQATPALLVAAAQRVHKAAHEIVALAALDTTREAAA